MSAMMKALGLDRLSVDERARLAQELWDSVVAETEGPALTDAQRADLQRRLAAYEADPKAGSSWEEVEARLLKRQP